MRRTLLLVLLLAGALQAIAQQHLYHWHLKGYAGIANYYNTDRSSSSYFKANHNLLYQLELGKSLGSTFCVAASVGYGHVRGLGQPGPAFTTKVRTAAAKLYFYTDNGWMFGTSAVVSPYFFGGVGLSTLRTKYNGDEKETRGMPVVPFGMGLKFRLSERWQLDLQTEAMYNTRQHLAPVAAEQNKYNNTILHTGIALAYSFGFKQSTFKAPRFYVGETSQYAQGELLPARKDSSMLDFILALPLKRVPVGQPPATDSLTVAAQQNLSLPSDTLVLQSQPVDRVAAGEVFTSRLVPVPDTAVATDAVGTTASVKQPAVADSLYQEKRSVTQTSRSAKRIAVTDSMAVDSARAAVAQKRQETKATPRTQATEQAQQQVRTTRKSRVESEVALEDSLSRTKQPTVPQGAPSVKREAVEEQKAAAPAARQQIVVRTPERRTEVQQRTVYVPVYRDTNRSGLALLLEKDQQRLEEANRENRRLRSNMDSLSALVETDTSFTGTQELPIADTAPEEDSVLQYMDRQAALNDSILQRLALYQMELARLQAPAPAAAAAPVAVAPMVSDSTNVFFAVNAAKVPAGSFNSLLSLVARLKQDPTLKLLLAGYTDQQGNPDYNLVLSRKRAEAVATFLQEQGIAQERIATAYRGEVKANGQTNPVNRRVTVYLLQEPAR